MHKPDPAIDAIREARSKISASVGHDLKKLVDRYQTLQKEHPERVLSKPARVGQAVPNVP